MTATRVKMDFDWIRHRFAQRRETPCTKDIPEAIVDRIAEHRGDHALNADMLPIQPLKPAAVLVPLVDRKDEITILFTRRTAHLAHHAGQISFPGGHIEADDSGPRATALRETEEEIGLDRRHIDIVGCLDIYLTRTGFVVTPVVGVVSPPFELSPDAHEVAEVFEVPLAFLINRANHLRHKATFEGVDRHFYAMPYGDYYIWGATAGMLVNLCDILDGE